MAHRSADRETSLRRPLVERALRVTEQRMTLLRATDYRNLVALAEAGILVCTRLGDQLWRYELPRGGNADRGIHPHFVCTDRRRVRCLDERTVSLHGEAARAAVTEVQLRGRRSPCAR